MNNLFNLFYFLVLVGISLVSCNGYDEFFPESKYSIDSSHYFKCNVLKGSEFIYQNLNWIWKYDEFLENDYLCVTTPAGNIKFNSCSDMIVSIQPDPSSPEYDAYPNFPAQFFTYYIIGHTGQLRVLSLYPDNEWIRIKPILRIRYQ